MPSNISTYSERPAFSRVVWNLPFVYCLEMLGAKDGGGGLPIGGQ